MGRRDGRRYPFAVPAWPAFRQREIPAALVDQVARAFPANGLPELSEHDLIRLEVCLQRFVYSQDWP